MRLDVYLHPSGIHGRPDNLGAYQAAALSARDDLLVGILSTLRAHVVAYRSIIGELEHYAADIHPQTAEARVLSLPRIPDGSHARQRGTPLAHLTRHSIELFLQLLNLGLKDTFTDGVQKLGFNMEDVIEQERDAALGNGGLGRLAACYLDSSASQELPVWGYGLRYKYGIFQQLISPQGEQLEVRCMLLSGAAVRLRKCYY